MSIQWDPSPIAFTLPVLHVSVYWYGIFFALGLFFSFFLCKSLLKLQAMREVPNKQLALFMERLFFSSTLAILVFARLFHVVFYDWSYFQGHPGHIFSVWEGGLASHGALLGLLCGTWYCYKTSPLFSRYRIGFLALLDAIALASFPAATLIRIGNFFNQEIVGVPTSTSLGVLFLHPLDAHLEVIPRHPVQLYEAFSYAVFGIIFFFNRKKLLLKEGTSLGIVLITFFSLRFLLEYLKAPQTAADLSSTLSTGQELSIPCILIGLCLVFFRSCKHTP